MKLIKGFIFAFLFVVIGTTTVFATDNIVVEIDGQRVSFSDQQPIIKDGRTLVPVRGVFEQLGYNVGWEQSTQTATLSNGANTVLITLGKTAFTTNGKTYNLDVPAQAINARTMLPLRAVLESVGYGVDWDGNKNIVIISSNGLNNIETKDYITNTLTTTTQDPLTEAKSKIIGNWIFIGRFPTRMQSSDPVFHFLYTFKEDGTFTKQLFNFSGVAGYRTNIVDGTYTISYDAKTKKLSLKESYNNNSNIYDENGKSIGNYPYSSGSFTFPIEFLSNGNMQLTYYTNANDKLEFERTNDTANVLKFVWNSSPNAKTDSNGSTDSENSNGFSDNNNENSSDSSGSDNDTPSQSTPTPISPSIDYYKGNFTVNTYYDFNNSLRSSYEIDSFKITNIEYSSFLNKYKLEYELIGKLIYVKEGAFNIDLSLRIECYDKDGFMVDTFYAGGTGTSGGETFKQKNHFYINSDTVRLEFKNSDGLPINQ